MGNDGLPTEPPLPWRIGSSFIIGVTGFLSRTFLLRLSNLEVHGWAGFKQVLDERQNVDQRTKGLITVSNHLSIMDDPIIWGALPFSYHWDPNNTRWSLASHDIAFTNKFTSTFFSLGNTLPTHRQMHSPHGGLLQPTITQTIRLLSDCPFAAPTEHRPLVSDPFSSGELTYSTKGTDSFPSPSSYATRRHSWVHIFPEGRIHQHPDRQMRYFKWGISRLILEAEPAPDVVPMFIEGFENVLHESRSWPRFLPRAGRSVSITFGDRLDGERVFGDLRRRWQRLVERHRKEGPVELGVLTDDELGAGDEVVRLREECTLRVRDQVSRLRRLRGYADQDPKASRAETWRHEGHSGSPKGEMDDGSWVGDT